MRRGIVVGRFLPPHAGHVLLCETATRLIDRLTILIHGRPDDTIPLATRAAWMTELFPAARVIAHQEATARPDWPAIVARHHPEPVDAVFAADAGGERLAKALGARPVTIDPKRQAIPARSADIRADPLAHWHHLPAPVRAHHARTICLHGPESTGKSTVAPRLAARFDTIVVPEYGRTYCEQHGLDLSMDDLVAIGKGHQAMTEAALRQCGGRLILDTDPLMTAAWADMLFGRRDPWFDAFTATADLYLLFDIDMPWVDDGTRFFGEPSQRQRFFDISRAELDRRGLPYAVIGGPAEGRYDKAVAAIEAAGLG
ncbi:AAA family ATPase [Sphingomonas naphthae]|uniref:AAA family ATPase n=1 Tax=Sphingomonas naphthae TaxID=1813468 RepID=A0ABY7TKV9_9SPHN|nr:AAA family ATPase [Sphingomonas naphthae]WCT73347.1 AAA family ATPase [Sphingomonas naphthae]